MKDEKLKIKNEKLCGETYEITEDMFAYVATLLGVELGGVEVVTVEGGTVVKDMMSGGYGLRTEGTVVAVYEIDIGIRESLIERRTEVRELVPAHGGHLIFTTDRDETADIGREDAEAVDIALLGVLA